MDLSELMSHLSTMEPAELVKVRKTVDMLLGGADSAPDTWSGHVWAALCKSLKARGLRLPHYSAIASSPDKKRKLADGAEAIREFLEKATGQTDEHRLRSSLPFVIDTCVRRMERSPAPMSASVVLNRLTDFPAYVASAFPGCAASPAQFSMIRSLHSRSGNV